MKIANLLFIASLFCGVASSLQAQAVTFSVNPDGSFISPIAEPPGSSDFVYVTDNNLTNGYAAGFDLTDSPSILNTAGAAAFQWGKTSNSYAYAHPSALWFDPVSVTNVLAEQSFDLGYLSYRNGTIGAGTGASSITLDLTLPFTSPSGLPTQNSLFTFSLINTTNTGDPIASADIVQINNFAAPLNFTDAAGNQYYLETTFKVDQTTIDNSLSTYDQFRVFEGATGSATLIGRITVSPVPEPGSIMLLLCAGVMLRWRRRSLRALA